MDLKVRVGSSPTPGTYKMYRLLLSIFLLSLTTCSEVEDDIKETPNNIEFEFSLEGDPINPVSYTHLTLPTKRIV